jgi:hypothetical protein
MLICLAADGILPAFVKPRGPLPCPQEVCIAHILMPYISLDRILDFGMRFIIAGSLFLHSGFQTVFLFIYGQTTALLGYVEILGN